MLKNIHWNYLDLVFQKFAQIKNPKVKLCS